MLKPIKCLKNMISNVDQSQARVPNAVLLGRPMNDGDATWI